MSQYKFGEEVDLSEMIIIKSEDKNLLRTFCCGNVALDRYIRDEIFEDFSKETKQGLHFMVLDKSRNVVVAFISLLSSGIVHNVSPYVDVLPAIKLDVFAVDKEYQKLRYYSDIDEDEHVYLSDIILGNVISHCYKIDEEYAKVDYICLYADKGKEKFYKRNGFKYYDKYMEREHKAETRKNTPMYLDL